MHVLKRFPLNQFPDFSFGGSNILGSPIFEKGALPRFPKPVPKGQFEKGALPRFPKAVPKGQWHKMHGLWISRQAIFGCLFEFCLFSCMFVYFSLFFIYFHLFSECKSGSHFKPTCRPCKGLSVFRWFSLMFAYFSFIFINFYLCSFIFHLFSFIFGVRIGQPF